MPPTNRQRIDWMPSRAGAQALGELGKIRPDLGRQALIDYAVVAALSALRYQRWTPPVLFGRNRDVWRLPADCKPEHAEALPGNDKTKAR